MSASPTLLDLQASLPLTEEGPGATRKGSKDSPELTNVAFGRVTWLKAYTGELSSNPARDYDENDLRATPETGSSVSEHESVQNALYGTFCTVNVEDAPISKIRQLNRLRQETASLAAMTSKMTDPLQIQSLIFGS